MPADTKPAGDIFGGWIMSLMDVAGGTQRDLRCKRARRHSRGDRHGAPSAREGGRRGELLHRVGARRADLVDLARQAWALRQRIGDRINVTSADFTYVALDDAGQPRPIPCEAAG